MDFNMTKTSKVFLRGKDLFFPFCMSTSIYPFLDHFRFPPNTLKDEKVLIKKNVTSNLK